MNTQTHIAHFATARRLLLGGVFVVYSVKPALAHPGHAGPDAGWAHVFSSTAHLPWVAVAIATVASCVWAWSHRRRNASRKLDQSRQG
jgi:hypothetical protein